MRAHRLPGVATCNVDITALMQHVPNVRRFAQNEDAICRPCRVKPVPAASTRATSVQSALLQASSLLAACTCSSLTFLWTPWHLLQTARCAHLNLFCQMSTDFPGETLPPASDAPVHRAVS